MKKDEVKGVTAHKERPVVVPLPYAPENQFMSRDEFLARRKAEKEAKAAAEAARIEALKKAGFYRGEPTKEAPKENEKLALLRRQLANAEKKLQENPESKSWKAKVKTLSEELEAAEATTE